MHSRPSRAHAAAFFAVAGLLAGAAHVLATEAGDLRLWREVLPLAGVVGAILGAAVRPANWRQGVLTALLALPAFALAYALAETAMMYARGEISSPAEAVRALAHWFAVVVRKAAVGAVAANLFGGVAGWLLGRMRA